MNDFGEDDYHYADADDFCDCSDEDWDLLEGTARCWSCGSRRSLSTAEIDEYWRGQTEFEKAMDRQLLRNRIGQIWFIFRNMFGRKRSAPDLDDDIPF